MNNKELVKKLREVKVLGEQNEQQLERGIDKNAKIRKILEEYYEKDTEKVESAMTNIQDTLEKVSRKTINDRKSSKKEYEQAVKNTYGNDSVKNELLELISDDDIKRSARDIITSIQISDWNRVATITDETLTKIRDDKNKPTWLPALIIYLIKLNRRVESIDYFEKRETVIKGAKDVNGVIGVKGLQKKLVTIERLINKSNDYNSVQMRFQELASVATGIKTLTSPRTIVNSLWSTVKNTVGVDPETLPNISAALNKLSSNVRLKTAEALKQDINKLDATLSNYEKKIKNSPFKELRHQFVDIAKHCLSKAKNVTESESTEKDNELKPTIENINQTLDGVSAEAKKPLFGYDIEALACNIQDLSDVASKIRQCTQSGNNESSTVSTLKDAGICAAGWARYQQDSLPNISKNLSELAERIKNLSDKPADSDIKDIVNRTSQLIVSLGDYQRNKTNEQFQGLRTRFVDIALDYLNFVLTKFNKDASSTPNHSMTEGSKTASVQNLDSSSREREKENEDAPSTPNHSMTEGSKTASVQNLDSSSREQTEEEKFRKNLLELNNFVKQNFLPRDIAKKVQGFNTEEFITLDSLKEIGNEKLQQFNEAYATLMTKFSYQSTQGVKTIKGAWGKCIKFEGNIEKGWNDFYEIIKNFLPNLKLSKLRVNK